MENDALYAKLFRLTGSFRDQERERAFINKQWTCYNKRIRITSILTGIAYLTGIYLDYTALAHTPFFALMMTARILTFLAALSSIVATFTEMSGRDIQKFILIYFVFITLTESLELWLKPELGSQNMPVLLLILLFYYLIFPVQLKYAVAGSLFAAIVYSSILIFVHKLSLETILPTIIGFILVSLISISLLRLLNRARRVEYYSMDQLIEVNRELQNEIAQRQKAQKKLEELASVDALTKVFNRRHFSEHAQREISRSYRSSRSLSLIYFDIDHFKEVNDSYGHDVGDVVLQEVAHVSKNTVRGVDILGRMGGEEFACLLPESNLEEAEIVAERIRKRIAGTRITVSGGDFFVTASFGVSSLDLDGRDNLPGLLKRADVALYQAKDLGRNRVVIWNDQVYEVESTG